MPNKHRLNYIFKKSATLRMPQVQRWWTTCGFMRKGGGRMRESTLYTDGACPGNGTEDAKGGMGYTRGARLRGALDFLVLEYD